MTALFTDVAKFSTIEIAPSNELVDFINVYLIECVR